MKLEKPSCSIRYDELVTLKVGSLIYSLTSLINFLSSTSFLVSTENDLKNDTFASSFSVMQWIKRRYGTMLLSIIDVTWYFEKRHHLVQNESPVIVTGNRVINQPIKHNDQFHLRANFRLHPQYCLSSLDILFKIRRIVLPLTANPWSWRIISS